MSLRPIVNQIALASQMHIHGERMADYAGSVVPRLAARRRGVLHFAPLPATLERVPRHIYLEVKRRG